MGLACLANGLTPPMRSSSCRRLASTLVAGRRPSCLLVSSPTILGSYEDAPSSQLGRAAEASNNSRRMRQQQVRGKKTKTTISLADLPQGPIGPSLLKAERKTPTDEDGKQQENEEEEAEAAPAYPTVVLQARRNMARFDNCVLLTRVGGFYELYFEHAEEYGPLLNLKVASKKTNAGPVPMVGFLFSLAVLLLAFGWKCLFSWRQRVNGTGFIHGFISSNEFSMVFIK